MIQVRHRRLERALVRKHQVIQRRLPGVRAFEVRAGAHDDDAREIGQVVSRRAEEGFERGVVFLGGGAVGSGAVCEDLGGVGEGRAQEVAGVVNVCGGDVAFDHRGGARAGLVDVSWRRGVVGAVGLRGLGVGEVRSAGEARGQGSQLRVDLEDLGAVDAGRVLVGVPGALGDVAGRVVGGELAQVDLVLESDLDGEAGEGGAADGADFWVDACDAGDEEVGVREVEERREGDGRDGDGGVDLALACHQLAHAVVGGAVHVGKDGRGAGDGDVVREQVEFGDSPPGGGFRFELRWFSI